jgi:hypothetical protein
MTAPAVPVLEVQEWANNSELIEAVFDIHVWPKRWASGPDGPDVMDVTFGYGLWWKWVDGSGHGLSFTSHDMKHDRVDFTNLPEADRSMDVVAFDPDYVAPGGRDTSTIPDFNERYGLNDPYESPASLQAHINAGLSECARVLRPQGILLVKCSTYVSSGKPWLGEYHTIGHGLDCGLKVEDIFVHVAGTGPQPKRETRQKHARSNSSRLIVFRKPGRRKRIS